MAPGPSPAFLKPSGAHLTDYRRSPALCHPQRNPQRGGLALMTATAPGSSAGRLVVVRGGTAGKGIRPGQKWPDLPPTPWGHGPVPPVSPVSSLAVIN